MFMRKELFFCLAFLILLSLLSGCASTQVYKTIGFTEPIPPISSDQVKVFERYESITDNFQTIGKVTVNCNTGVSKKNAILKMQETASLLGADGIIDFHRGAGCQWRYDAGVHYNGLMVKWLPINIPKKSLNKNFIVTRLPIMNPAAPDEKLKFDDAIGYQIPMLDFPWMNDFVFKGYYVLPECDRTLENNICQEAQLLLNASMVSKSKGINFPVAVVGGLANSGLDHEAVIEVELIDGNSGEVLIKKQAAGEAFKQWFAGIVESGEELAAGEAIKAALKEIPQVSDQAK